MAKFYVLCDDDCRYESMTSEQILTAIAEALEQGYVSDPDGAVFSKVKELNKNGAVQVWVGTETEFNTLNPVPEINKTLVRIGNNGVLYLCTDDSSIPDIVPVESGGTGATTAATACANIGALPTSGGTLLGTLTVDGGEGWVSIRISRNLNSAVREANLYSDEEGLTLDANKDGENVNHLSLKETHTVLKRPLTVSSGGTGATTAEQARKNLGAASVEDVEEALGKVGTTYAAAEVKTNDVWIDGKPIYRYLYRYESTTNGNNMSIGFLPSVPESVISIRGSFITDNGQFYPFPHVYCADITGYGAGCYIKSTGEIMLQIGGDYKQTKYMNFIFEYTKADA